MHDALSALEFAAAVTPTPEPTVDPALVSPGPWGFVIVALLAFAVVGLVWDMMRRIRRGRVRADIIEELDAEEAQAAEEGGRGPDEDSSGEGSPGAPRR